MSAKFLLLVLTPPSDFPFPSPLAVSVRGAINFFFLLYINIFNIIIIN